MDVLEGYPYVCAPVTIGDNVWIMARSTILPGVRIGNNVAIGNNSVVNSDVPDGSFCAGIPARIIRANEYPKKLTQSQKDAIILGVIEDYRRLAQYKDFDPLISYKENVISFKVKGLEEEATFDTQSRTISGVGNQYVEDFRDYLRHRGIKFFTDKPFRMITPSDFRKWLED
jgi:uncharacterized protein YihD (DUF1040 family)